MKIESNMNEGKRCLVIGGNGFVGSHIVDTLAANGYEVFAFDRYSGEVRHDLHANIHSIKGDIFDLQELTTYIERVDYVFHCVSATTPAASDDNPYIDIEQNLLNNVKIFEACAKSATTKKVIYLSSGGTIYGGEGHGREDEAIHPISPYAIAKFASEGYLAYFKRKHGLQYVVYRLSNPYGPGQVTKHNQGVVPRFIHHIRHDLPITVYGDGTSSRDYIYIEDVATMIVESFDRDSTYDIYNIGSGKQTTLHEIIATLEEIFKKKAKIIYDQTPATFVHSAPLDMNRYKMEFGISATTGLYVGLEATANYLETFNKHGGL